MYRAHNLLVIKVKVKTALKNFILCSCSIALVIFKYNRATTKAEIFHKTNVFFFKFYKTNVMISPCSRWTVWQLLAFVPSNSRKSTPCSPAWMQHSCLWARMFATGRNVKVNLFFGVNLLWHFRLYKLKIQTWTEKYIEKEIWICTALITVN